MGAQADRYELQRFLDAQSSGVYERSLQELCAGRKESHWMWFIFPQLRGLGHSATATLYGLGGHGEAAAFAAHPVLGARLRRSCAALLVLDREHAAEDIFGDVDALKLRSSMTLFANVTGDRLFDRVLERFFDGPDPKTLDLLAPPPTAP